jgi:hypothetical protein
MSERTRRRETPNEQDQPKAAPESEETATDQVEEAEPTPPPVPTYRVGADGYYEVDGERRFASLSLAGALITLPEPEQS